MSLTPPAGLEESDFETIEDAVLETARGRWFLREFARRARGAETARLLDAVTRIERALTGGADRADAVAIDFEQRAFELEERHARLSDIAWVLRERGYDGDICAMIEQEARALGRMARTMRGGAPAGAARLQAPAPRLDAPTQEPKDQNAPPRGLERPDLPMAEAPAQIEPPRAEPRPWQETAAAALAPFERMSTRERMALCA